MFELAQLRAFVVVATELNFGRAARRLNITQPPLSRQIQALERELDVKLFTRTTRQVALTPGGHAFLAEAQAILRRSEAAAVVARRAAQETTGALSVGFVGATTYGFLPRLAALARAEQPGLALSLIEMDSAAQVQAIELGRLDVGLVRPVPEIARLRSALVERERLALAMPASHPLAGRRRPDPQLLDGAPMILYSAEARHLHSVIEPALASRSVRPVAVQRLMHAQAILSLVSAGLGLALVPESAKNACFDEVTFRPIDLGEARAELHVVWSEDNPNPALAGFRELAERVGRREERDASVPLPLAGRG
uniref:LysR family transcriptional regulator n=1 Tax=Methylopila sp. M107 TaxID=1101190 RepID=UPI00036889B2|nr:LysR family transcriptional regulator [Methylopila sp. M107]